LLEYHYNNIGIKYKNAEGGKLSMLKAFKFRLYPSKEQMILINKHLGSNRFVYNYYLSKRIKTYEENKTTLTYNQCATDLPKLKKEFEWLKEIDSISLQQALRNLDTAYQNFFKEVKKGNKNQGFPKFKSKRDNRLSYRTQNVNNNISITENKIKLPKLGLVKFAKSREVGGAIKNATISKVPSGKYFISILCEVSEPNKLPHSPNNIGIDLGIKDFAITSDGEIISNPKYYSKYEKKLVKLQRQLSKKQKGSSNRNKARIKVARLHEKITNTRTDFLQKLSTRLINENQVICLEDLNVEGMVKNHKLAKSISDVSWSSFTTMLKYKAEWYGRQIIVIDRYFPSSKLCNVCGWKYQDLDLSIREWTCPECKTHHDRDINASINILKEGLKQIV